MSHFSPELRLGTGTGRKEMAHGLPDCGEKLISSASRAGHTLLTPNEKLQKGRLQQTVPRRAATPEI